MEILKGTVQDKGYPNTECIYGKVDDKTLYYFMPNGELPNGNYIANINLKEAINHAAATSIGVIDKNGNVLIPFENKSIKLIENNLLLVEKNTPTQESVVALVNSKNNPANNEALAANNQAKKDQIIQVMGMSGDFLFANQFSEAAIYTFDGLNVANGYYSYIAELNDDYYFTSVEPNSKIVKFNPSMLQQNIEKNEPEEQSVGQQVEANQPEETKAPENQMQEIMPNIDIPIQNQIINEIPNEVGNSNIDTQQQMEIVNDNKVSNEPEENKDALSSIPDIPTVQSDQAEMNQENNGIGMDAMEVKNTTENNIGQDTNEIENTAENNVGQDTSEAENTAENNVDQDTNEIENTAENDVSQDTSDVENTAENNVGQDTSDVENTAENNVDQDTDEEEDTAEDEIDQDTDEEEDTAEDEVEQDTDDEEDTAEDEIDQDTDEEEDTAEDEIEQDADEEEDTVEDEIEQDTDEEEDTAENNVVEDSNKSDDKQNKKYELTDNDIATPGIQNAKLTIINLVAENKRQREQIDDLAGKNAVLEENLKIVREYGEGQAIENQSLKSELESSRAQLLEEKRKNAKLLIIVDKQDRTIKQLEIRNTDLSGQVAGLDELNRAVAEANMLVQPVEQANDSNAIYDKFNYLGNEKGRGKAA